MRLQNVGMLIFFQYLWIVTAYFRKMSYLCNQTDKSGFHDMHWIILILAGLCEVAFAYCLGRAKGISGMEWYTWITAFGVFYILSAILLAKATEVLPIGTAYPVWTGIGAVGAVLIGIFIFKEPATFWRLFFLTTLILSIIGLKTIS